MATTALSTIWEQVLERVQSSQRELFRAWFLQLRPVALDRGHLRVQVQNEAQRIYLEKACLSAFSAAAQVVTGRLVTVAFETANEDSLNAHSSTPELDALRFDRPLQPNYSFEGFIEGRCNRLALAGARAVAEAPGTCYNPLYLYGDSGCGKTHLLNAIGLSVRSRTPDAVIGYFPCDEYTRRLIECFEQANQGGFHEWCRSLDILLVDDVDRLAGRTHTQDEFYSLFNHCYQRQRQIVLTAAQSPAGLAEMAPRLSSRFASGLVAFMELPCVDTRAAIIRSKALVKGLQFDTQMIELVASQWEGSIQVLEDLLVRMDAQAQFRGSQVTAGIVQEVLDRRRLSHAQ